MFEILFNIAGVILIFIFLCLAFAEYHNATNDCDNDY